MDFLELAEKRYSVRAYKTDPVPDDKLRQVLEAARLAPTAANHQPFQLVVIHTAGREEELNRICKPAWFVQAPLVICACGIQEQAWVRRESKSYLDVDVAIAFDHLILAATDLGLGTCWIAALDPAMASEILGLPNGVEPIAFTPMGYPGDQPKEKRRKPMAEVVHYEGWRV